MKQQSPDSNKQSTELVDLWDARLKALDARLSAYGPTVTVREGSDSSEYKVTFPQARASRAKPQPE
jgi:hypothetical protein